MKLLAVIAAWFGAGLAITGSVAEIIQFTSAEQRRSRLAQSIDAATAPEGMAVATILRAK